MATVAELITFLQGLDQTLSVEVLEEYTSGYQTSTRWETLTLDKYSNYWTICGETLYLGYE